jgi:hypothetical protein
MGREKQWYDYNYTLLATLFTTNEYATEYDQSRRPVHLIGDRYIDPDISTIIRRFQKSIISQIQSLTSIRARLGLIELAVEPVLSDNNPITRLAERLHLVARQLQRRHAGRPPFRIGDEYDLQDLFHAMLTIFFDDIRKEEVAPSFAGAGARMDFFLPSLSSVVELKKVRESLSSKALGEQLIVDIGRYKTHRNCRTLYCFVYDPDRLLDNPRGIEAGNDSAESGRLGKLLDCGSFRHHLTHTHRHPQWYHNGRYFYAFPGGVEKLPG